MNYYIASEVVDRCDGTYTVLMGRLTEMEILQAKVVKLSFAK